MNPRRPIMNELEELADLAGQALPAVIATAPVGVGTDPGKAADVAKSAFTIAQAMFDEKRRWTFDTTKGECVRPVRAREGEGS
jgi:hypothetical protein